VADTVLAGLPRLVRVRDEVRMRGIAALGIGAATVGWWMLAWLLGEGVDGLRFGLAAIGIGIPALIAAWLISRRRLRVAREFQAPPRNAVYETIAAARDRRTRLSGVVLFGVIILMIFDHFSHGAGEMAGLVAGLFIPFGAIDIRESHQWSALEREHHDTRLYVLVPAHAMMAPFSPDAVYERPRSDAEVVRLGFPGVEH
jgi:heme A synthase